MADLKKIMKKARELAEPYCVEEGAKFRLKQIDPDDTGDFKQKDKEDRKSVV